MAEPADAGKVAETSAFRNTAERDEEQPINPGSSLDFASQSRPLEASASSSTGPRRTTGEENENMDPVQADFSCPIEAKNEANSSPEMDKCRDRPASASLDAAFLGNIGSPTDSLSSVKDYEDRSRLHRPSGNANSLTRKASVRGSNNGAPIYTWLVQSSGVHIGTRKQPVAGNGDALSGWVAFRAADGRRLERALDRLQKRMLVTVNGNRHSAIVPVEKGRYDVDLKRRILIPVYWDEPERRVIRSLWFHGRVGARVPYEENDSEAIEAAFDRLQARKERVPLLVPVNQGLHDVRIDILEPSNSSGGISDFFGSGPRTARRELQGSFVAGRPNQVSNDDLRDEPVFLPQGEVQYTAVQESVDRSIDQNVSRVWRRYWVDGDEQSESDEDMLPNRVECLVFVVHGIGQYQMMQQGRPERFIADVRRVRNMSVQRLRQRMDEDLPVRGRIEYMPLQWFESVHTKIGMGARLQNVTLPSVPALRNFANFAIADMMVYQDPEWRDAIHADLQDQMSKMYAKFAARTPEFTGQVAVIGHSLGSVIMFDILQKTLVPDSGGLGSQKPAESDVPHSDHQACNGHIRSTFLPREIAEKAARAYHQKTDLPQCPTPLCLFAMGSPLGLFLTIRLADRGHTASSFFRGLGITQPSSRSGGGWRFFNIFHPDDPIAYRLEPLLNSDYIRVPSRMVPHHGGLRFHQAMRQWVGRVFAQQYEKKETKSWWDVLFIEESEELAKARAAKSESDDLQFGCEGITEGSVAVGRIDWSLQHSVLESINEFLSAMNSHFAYWECEDVFHFIVDQVLDASQTMDNDQ